MCFFCKQQFAHTQFLSFLTQLGLLKDSSSLPSFKIDVLSRIDTLHFLYLLNLYFNVLCRLSKRLLVYFVNLPEFPCSYNITVYASKNNNLREYQFQFLKYEKTNSAFIYQRSYDALMMYCRFTFVLFSKVHFRLP